MYATSLLAAVVVVAAVSSSYAEPYSTYVISNGKPWVGAVSSPGRTPGQYRGTVTSQGRPTYHYLHYNNPYSSNSNRDTRVHIYNSHGQDSKRRHRTDFIRLLLNQRKNKFNHSNRKLPVFPPLNFPHHHSHESSEESFSSFPDSTNKRFRDSFFDSHESNEKSFSFFPDSGRKRPGHSFFDSHESSEESFNFPKFPAFPKPRWPILPFVPKTPKVHELPDNYNNETHSVHIVNGHHVTVNTTTNKKSNDGSTFFFRKNVIHIRPHDTPAVVPEEEFVPEETTDGALPEETTDGALPEETTDDGLPEERTVASLPEEYTVRPVQTTTTTEVPVKEEPTTESFIIYEVPGEAVLNKEVVERDVRLSRDTSGATPALLRGPQRSAAYMSKGKGRGKDAKPNDLSRDTLVNKLDKVLKEGKEKDPDAEAII